MKLLLFTFIYVTAMCYGDIIRTVYCRNQCTDYISIPEASMPLCAPEHLKMKECGSVITCDWAEAERDNARPIANISSDVICCYRATIKEKGDCANSITAELPRKDISPESVALTDICTIHFIPWLLCTALLVVVILQVCCPFLQ
ncbi:unnamed protein product [Cylicostephanus goldi]|uniref:Uncharacterized protein n=1 Tax=Cylicostephanus goldi TaxID=71465 RepID=A0A3P6SCR7_CYLGO|nr:unnamed protein product [Cylicostephanus goldi]